MSDTYIIGAIYARKFDDESIIKPEILTERFVLYEVESREDSGSCSYDRTYKFLNIKSIDGVNELHSPIKPDHTYVLKGIENTFIKNYTQTTDIAYKFVSKLSYIIQPVIHRTFIS